MANYIPDEHFKGVQSTKTKCPLAFITPTGTDKAAEKRIETVRNWAGGYNWKQDKDAHFETIKNVAMTGFKIAEEIRRWSTSNVVWRIVDPRGFQLEISSGNMAYLMSESIIDHGEIKAELQWCRAGAQNYLLPTDSDEYKKYSAITNVIKGKKTIKDVTIGDTIVDGTGDQGMFLGGYHIVYPADWDGEVIKSHRRYYIKMENGDLLCKSSFKNIAIVEKGKPEDNKDWSDFLNNSEETRTNYMFFSKKKPDMKAIVASLRFKEFAEKDPNNYNYQFMKYNDKFYVMAMYIGGTGQAQEIINSLGENTLNYIYENNSSCCSALFNRRVQYNEVRDNGVHVRLACTINNKDYIF